MDGYRISDAARETGFSASALRFYEQQGIVVPERSGNGYRTYDERSIASLRFISRSKRLGLSLAETAELLALLDDDACDPVQSRMSSMVSDRIDRAQEQVADLVEFTAELQRVAARLGSHTPDGACDDACGCTTDSASTALAVVQPVALAGLEQAHISCSLDAGSVGGRLDHWKDMLTEGVRRETIDGGVRVHFARDVDVTAISELAAAEQTCCNFFTFGIGIGADAITLDITGPAEAQEVIVAFAGA
jgi:DNA-binding transcriptional MerR regulator